MVLLPEQRLKALVDFYMASLTEEYLFSLFGNQTFGKGGYDYFTRPVIDGKSVFENVTGSWQIPFVGSISPNVSYPEGYYYSFNITSQFLGNKLYTNSTNKTTVVYVYRNPTSVSIQNTSGVVSGVLGENIELTAKWIEAEAQI